MSGQRRTDAAAIQRAEDQARILARRAAGATLAQIAAEEGVSESAVSHRISRALAATRAAPAAELVALEAERLDALQRALWPAAVGSPTQPGPRAKPEARRAYSLEVSSRARAAEAVLRVMERRARLLGLDDAQQRELDEARRQLPAEQGRLVWEAMHRVANRLALSDEQRARFGQVAMEELRRVAAEQVVAGELES